MSENTILKEYCDWLKDRESKGEIVTSTCDTYLNDASRIYEVLLRHMPVDVIEGYMRTEGYKGHYGHVIEVLRSMARGHSEINFGDPGQSRLPGV